VDPDEETVFVRTRITRSMLALVDEYNARLVRTQKGAVTRTQALRELLDHGLASQGLVESGKKR
jgi:hypothetical protein